MLRPKFLRLKGPSGSKGHALYAISQITSKSVSGSEVRVSTFKGLISSVILCSSPESALEISEAMDEGISKLLANRAGTGSLFVVEHQDIVSITVTSSL